MYINFWYPIVRSEDLGYDQPEKVKVLGCNLVAFRDQDGKAHVLSDTCVHRGGALGKGWVKDGCVVCPYHGWRYGGDGWAPIEIATSALSARLALTCPENALLVDYERHAEN